MQIQTLFQYQSPLGVPIEIKKQTFAPAAGRPAKKISFVAGLHGDEWEGLYVCHLLSRYLQDLEETHAESFVGEINIYPAANPQAVCDGTRLTPFFSVDANRSFGAGRSDSLPESVASDLFEDIRSSSDFAVDIHASNQRLLELPQIRIVEEFDLSLTPLASECNVDIVWVHPMAGVFRSTLAYNLNKARVPALVVETGICLRIHPEFCRQVFHGLVRLMRHVGILKADDPLEFQTKKPRVVYPHEVGSLQAGKSGLFVHQMKLGQSVREGEKAGEIIDPIQGRVLEEIRFPFSGTLFTVCENPIAYEGAPLARAALDSPAGK